MTLVVTAYHGLPDGTRTELPLPSDLAGFESTRHTFYGGERARQLGLKLLPRLRNEAVLEVSGAELVELRAEVEAMLSSLAEGDEGDYWRFRLRNLRQAIEAARPYGDDGSVCLG